MVNTDAGIILPVDRIDWFWRPASVANNDSVIVTEGAAVTVDVLANDSGPFNGDSLSVTSATATNGTVTINADSTLTYQGNQNQSFNDIDTITYTINDAYGNTDTATVDITVNVGPVATNDTVTTNEDVLVTFDVLSNDTDADNDSLSIISAAAIDGTVVINTVRSSHHYIDGTYISF